MGRGPMRNQVAALLLLVAGCGGASPPPAAVAEAEPKAAPPAHSNGPEQAVGPSVLPTRLEAELRAAGLDPAALPPLASLAVPARDEVMKAFSRSLGVECTGCHVSDQDFKAETRNKQIARKMWQEFVMPNRHADGALFCDSCHDGKLEPLAEASKKAMQAYMKAEYAAKIVKSASGEELACSACHGEPFVEHVVRDLWKL
jgi:hypothetical protein